MPLSEPYRDSTCGFRNPFQPKGFELETPAGFGKIQADWLTRFTEMQRKSLILLRQTRQSLNIEPIIGRIKVQIERAFSKKNNAISRDNVPLNWYCQKASVKRETAIFIYF